MGIHNAKIYSILAEHEIKRKEDLRKFILIVAASLLIYATIITTCLKKAFAEEYFDAIAPVAIICTVIVGFVFTIASIKINGDFIHKLKNECLDEILKNFGDVHWGQKDTELETDENIKNVTDEELEESGLFESYNRRNTDDTFYGTYNGVNFKISETYMRRVSGSGKHRSETTIFQGVIISFKSNKKIKSRTIVSTKGDMTAKVSFIPLSLVFFFVGITMLGALPHGFIINGQTVWILVLLAVISLFLAYLVCKKQKGFDEVKLEDAEFLKKYNVYSGDQVEARYLVTPAFMERFSNLKTAFGTNRVKCSFFNEMFMIAISTSKNLFEIGSIFKTLTDYKTIEECCRELNSVFKMIDYFKLDEKTGI